MRKKCSSGQEKLLKMETEGQVFAKFLKSPEQFIQTVKGQDNFCFFTETKSGELKLPTEELLEQI